MNGNKDLYSVAAGMVAKGKGILAADESIGTAGKRLAMVNLPNEPEHRQDFRELLFTAPGIEEYLSGVIMHDSSIKNTTDEGVPFPDVLAAKGIIPGIKVDMGTKPLQGFPGEVITEGLDNLSERLVEYYDLGARFAKWRAVITIGERIPTDECMSANALMLARYAALCQEAKIVPMVEPEVIFHGEHDIGRAEEVTMRALQILFATLREYKVDLRAVILKSSMVLAGDGYKEQSKPEEVASATLRTFHLSVPYEVPGIVFLSGGQSPVRATENLEAIAALGKQPWAITFSYSRALEEPFLAAWQGKPENSEKAQRALLHRLKLNSAAREGKYTKETKETEQTT